MAGSDRTALLSPAWSSPRACFSAPRAKARCCGLPSPQQGLGIRRPNEILFVVEVKRGAKAQVTGLGRFPYDDLGARFADQRSRDMPRDLGMKEWWQSRSVHAGRLTTCLGYRGHRAPELADVGGGEGHAWVTSGAGRGLTRWM